MGERHATVLIVDDSPEDRLMYQRYLANTYAIYEAGLGASGLTICQTLRPDCILLASWLPDGDGIGWIARLRASLGDLAPPVILLMAAGSDAMAVEAMQQGAQDSLVKSQLTPELLQRAVRYAIEMATLRRALTVHYQQVQERTAALLAAEAEQQRLTRAARQAEHFAMLGRLAAGMSHEIRNPLGAIFLHVDLVEEELQGPSPEGSTLIAEALQEIKTQLGRLDELVQDYLSLVRIASIQREVHDLGDTVQDWVTEIRTQALAHGVTVHCENLAETRSGCIASEHITARRTQPGAERPGRHASGGDAEADWPAYGQCHSPAYPGYRQWYSCRPPGADF